MGGGICQKMEFNPPSLSFFYNYALLYILFYYIYFTIRKNYFILV